MTSAAYEIRATGEVPRRILADFEGVTVSTDPAGSTIHVALRDEAELHGLLEALSRGGYMLIDVRREPEPDLGEGWTGGEAPLTEPPPAEAGS
jgi:hypothetical protein